MKTLFLVTPMAVSIISAVVSALILILTASFGNWIAYKGQRAATNVHKNESGRSFTYNDFDSSKEKKSRSTLLRVQSIYESENKDKDKDVCRER